MHPSTDTEVAASVHTGDLAPHSTTTGPSNARAVVVTLPPADRASQMKLWGLVPEYVGGRYEGHGPDYDFGPEDDAEDAAFLAEGGWTIATRVEGGGRGHGLTTHRGVLHPDEYVDLEDLRARISERLGFTLDEIRSVYRQGPLSAAGRYLRSRIDARLLEVAESGGLLVELGSALGWAVREDGHCRTVENALSRAREGVR